MRRMAPVGLFLVLAATAACGGQASYVKASDAALGRVVVYRNGIAYYERRAKIEGDKLTLRVPGDKVDDFLKSLTVADASTGKALPISFPSGNVARSGTVDMTVQLGAAAGPRDVVLTYVTESPAWKPSYRVLVGEEGKVKLQGWAIVDNTSGENWESVRVGVGSSSALSFRFDLHSIRLVHRETLQSQDTFAKAPPRGGSVYREGEPQTEVVLGQLSDGDIPRQAGHPDMVEADEAMPAPAARERARRAPGAPTRAMGGGGGPTLAAKRPSRRPRPAARSPRDDARRIQAMAQALKNRKGTIVIEGYANPGEADPRGRSLDRANLLRNQLIINGVPPAQLRAEGKGVVPGQRAGVRLVQEPLPPEEQAKAAAPKVEESGAPVGESHFESKVPMTVLRGTSAMVSIVQGDAAGDVVYLYDAEAESGNARFPFKSVRFRNPTASTLESGPVTVYGNKRFIGEGLTDPIPPHALAVVPFALDRQVVVDREGSTNDRIARLVKLHRGVLTAEVQHVRLTKLKITNRQQIPVTVLVRHTVPKGWKITRSPKVTDRFGEARLFAVPLEGGQTRVLEVEEATPMTRTLDLRSPTGIDLVRVYLETPRVDPVFAAAMAKLLKLHHEIARLEEEIENLRQRGDEYRQRLDELHAQIVTLQAVKTKGSLMPHLQAKMKDISQRVQENTIAIVDRQEKLMVARVRFQDGLSELTLEKKEEEKKT